MHNGYERLDKVVNKAKAQRDTAGPDASFIWRLNNHSRGAEADKKQALEWPPQWISLALGVPDASLQSARLCGAVSILYSIFTLAWSRSWAPQTQNTPVKAKILFDFFKTSYL